MIRIVHDITCVLSAITNFYENSFWVLRCRTITRNKLNRFKTLVLVVYKRKNTLLSFKNWMLILVLLCSRSAFMYIVTRLISDVHFHITGPKFIITDIAILVCPRKLRIIFPLAELSQRCYVTAKCSVMQTWMQICFGYQPIKFLCFP